jgi:SAM-dependent methyltransferase
VAAQGLCRSILDNEPEHLRSLVLLGDVAQQQGRNKSALKLLGQALAIDCADTAAHDTIAMTHQALGRRDLAVRHFSQALVLGLQGAENGLKHNAAIAAALQRLAEAWPRQPGLAELLGAQGAAALAAEALLLAVLQSTVLCDLELERLFTAIRRGLLEIAVQGDPRVPDGDSLAFFCALAQQCFLNDYVFAFDDVERARVQQICDRLTHRLKTGAEAASLDVVAAASYGPLHTLPLAASLLARAWPDCVDRLLTQQIREPLAEAADRPSIATLTRLDDATSLDVRRQYEENPYPRWTEVAALKPTGLADFLHDKLGVTPKSWPNSGGRLDVLIAGCGTGSHSIDTARRFPHSQILAIDLSRSSLAYARRKTRELGIANVEYGQADILELAALDRRFDLIEAVGVLHHLSDPAAAWQVLLSLLRPNGLMFVGLYSASARQPLDAAQGYIAERGYRATPEDIRAFRQDLIRRGRVPPFRDFASTTGCRDLLFNVMEHRFTLVQIAEFLAANRLTFLGFEQLLPGTIERFREHNPDPAAMRDLACWHDFEQKHPRAFGSMYIFWVQKREPD